MKLIFLGTSSDAGKTLMSALFCRYLTRRGFDTVPFKASNFSNHSAMTSDGKEIGVGQVLQAAACEKIPICDMNPILLKPSKKGMIQMIINGRCYEDISPGYSPDVDELSRIAYESYDRLATQHEAVICEGSGSPVELNRMERDFANLRLMREKDIPAIIVGDIERGGVFAAIYGTWLLTEEKDRKNLKGFIINRFRCDSELLRSGIEMIEKLTGMECLGVVPYIDLEFPKEDLISDSDHPKSDRSVKDAHIRNLDRMLDIVSDSLYMDRMIRIASV